MEHGASRTCQYILNVDVIEGSVETQHLVHIHGVHIWAVHHSCLHLAVGHCKGNTNTEMQPFTFIHSWLGAAVNLAIHFYPFMVRCWSEFGHSHLLIHG